VSRLGDELGLLLLYKRGCESNSATDRFSDLVRTRAGSEFNCCTRQLTGQAVQVATVSGPARAAIEQAGGMVHRVYYNKLGMRAMLLPDWFAKKERSVPRAVQMVPYKKQWRYDRVGTIPATEAPAAVS
jgi:hypothetical protein